MEASVQSSLFAPLVGLPPLDGSARLAVRPGAMRPDISEVSEEIISSLVSDMNTVGFAELPNYLGAADICELQAFVEDAIGRANGQYVALTGKEAVAGTLLDGLSDSPRFQRLLQRIYERGTHKSAPQQAIYQVLRCLKGETGIKQSMIFHYDSFVVTALIPIVIPTEGKAGHLIMAPNRRVERKNYFRNLIDKIFIDNQLTQILLKAFANSPVSNFTRVVMTPGSLYLFWGYRSLHANEGCDVENIRATALFHFADPHAESLLRKRLGRQKV